MTQLTLLPTESTEQPDVPAWPDEHELCEACGVVSESEFWGCLGADDGNGFCPECGHEQGLVFWPWAARIGGGI